MLLEVNELHMYYIVLYINYDKSCKATSHIQLRVEWCCPRVGTY